MIEQQQYTPSTEQVRSHYVFNQSDHWDPARGEAFDRWLAKVRAEALRDAAAAMRRHKEPGHWNLRDEEHPSDASQSPDAWLERCAEREEETN